MKYGAFNPPPDLTKEQEELIHWAISSGVKKCSRCGLTLPTALFSVDRNAATGLQGYCRICNRENMLRWTERKELERQRAMIDVALERLERQELPRETA